MSIDPTVTTFVIDVNGDDPRWFKIDPSQYHSCDPDLRVEHLPVQPGLWRVSCRLLKVEDRSMFEVLRLINHRRLYHPTRAEVETMLDYIQDSHLNVMGICNQKTILKEQQAYHPVFQLISGQRCVFRRPYLQYCYSADYFIAVSDRVEL